MKQLIFERINIIKEKDCTSQVELLNYMGPRKLISSESCFQQDTSCSRNLESVDTWHRNKDGRFRLRNRSRNRNRLQILPIWSQNRNRNQLFPPYWNRSRNRNQNVTGSWVLWWKDFFLSQKAGRRRKLAPYQPKVIFTIWLHAAWVQLTVVLSITVWYNFLLIMCHNSLDEN